MTGTPRLRHWLLAGALVIGAMLVVPVVAGLV
ncbi:hypothetical protein GGR44_000491 [Sphingobium fontiphilum]|uniref:Uncharacterized protein n=1 Tax=Sphingobium fontiphilum TaxID=944425 RepID=A0A7W6DCS0_9SPHN|nr:hypothetical protein [Sphingobium fontiphilum]